MLTFIYLNQSFCSGHDLDAMQDTKVIRPTNYKSFRHEHLKYSTMNIFLYARLLMDHTVMVNAFPSIHLVAFLCLGCIFHTVRPKTIKRYQLMHVFSRVIVAS